MNPSIYIKLSGTLLTCNYAIFFVDGAKHNTMGRSSMQTERLERKTTLNLRSDTMLSYQFSRKLKLLGNEHSNVYQVI